MPLPTLHHDPVRTAYHRPASPSYTEPDPTASIAALYPVDVEAAQHLLAAEAVAALHRAGRPAAVGSYGPHATCETGLATGTLVLVPMADLLELDIDLAVEDDQDPAVWAVLFRDADGRLVDDPLPEHSCPSVLWATAAGIDPTVAPDLIAAVLLDPYLHALLTGGGVGGGL